MEGRIIKSCRHCQQSGHLAPKCPNKKNRSMNLFQEIAPPSTTLYELAKKLLRKTNHAATLAESRIVSDADFQLPKKKKKKKGAKLSVEEAQQKIEQHIHNATLKAAAEAQIAQNLEDEHRSQRLSQLNYTQHTSEVISRPSLREIMSQEMPKVAGKHSKVKPPPRGVRTQISQQPTTKGFR